MKWRIYGTFKSVKLRLARKFAKLLGSAAKFIELESDYDTTLRNLKKDPFDIPLSTGINCF